jgi:mannose-6-phosphate isomerase-like protein (cupin superfamily)
MMMDGAKLAYVRAVDFPTLDSTPITERFSQRLLDRESGAASCMVSYVRTPSGGGSPLGMHVHDVDQHFYVLTGTMDIEVDGERFKAPPGSLIVFPALVPHRNWNEGDEPTVHLAINAPLPPAGVAFSRAVG